MKRTSADNKATVAATTIRVTTENHRDTPANALHELFPLIGPCTANSTCIALRMTEAIAKTDTIGAMKRERYAPHCASMWWNVSFLRKMRV